jgi:hypothetical protein
MVDTQAGMAMAGAGASSSMDYSCLEETEEDMEDMQVFPGMCAAPHAPAWVCVCTPVLFKGSGCRQQLCTLQIIPCIKTAKRRPMLINCFCA